MNFKLNLFGTNVFFTNSGFQFEQPDVEIYTIDDYFCRYYKDVDFTKTSLTIGGIKPTSFEQFIDLVTKQKNIEHFVYDASKVSKGLKISIPYGVTIIDGSSTAGKSFVAYDIADQIKSKMILFNEPSGLFSLHDSSDLINAIAQVIFEKSAKVIIVDSISDLLTKLDGDEAPGSGGVSNKFFSNLARMSRELHLAGISLICVVNYRNQSAESSLANAMLGTTSCRINMQNDHVNVSSRSALDRREIRATRLLTEQIDGASDFAIINVNENNHDIETEKALEIVGDALKNVRLTSYLSETLSKIQQRNVKNKEDKGKD